MWHNYETTKPPLKEIDLLREADFLFDIEFLVVFKKYRVVLPVSQYIQTVGENKVTGWFVHGKNHMLENHFKDKFTILYWKDYPEPNI